MKTLTFFLFASLAMADWSTRETAQLRVTPFPMPSRVPPSLSWLVPPNAHLQPKGMQIIVQARPGVVLPVGDEYRVTVRYRGLDGKTYTVTRNLTPNKEGSAQVFIRCEIDEPLTVSVETLDRKPLEEAQ